MTYINKYSTVEKVFRVSSFYKGASVIEVPSLLSTFRIDVSKPTKDLRLEAQELYLTGILDYVNESEGMDTYLRQAMRLDVVINQLELEAGEELTFFTSLTTFPGETDEDPDELGIGFRLDVSENYEIPILLPELIDAMTGFLMMFNHRLIDSSISLN